MGVFRLALTAPEKALVRRAVEAFKPEKRYDDQRRESVLELLANAPSVADTGDFLEGAQPSKTGGHHE